MGVLTEEPAFTLCRVNQEAPFQGQFFKVVEGILDGVSNFQWIRRRGPDGKIISIECVISSIESES